MTAEIEKSILSGSVDSPTSKSMAHRLLICAALSDGESIIENVTFSDDIIATLNCLRQVGAQYTVKENTVIINGIRNIELHEEKLFDCNESGSTLRFIIPLLLLSDVKQQLTGKGRLLERPLDVYEIICREQNLLFERNKEISIKGKIKSGNYNIKGNISSQFITGMLLALSLLDSNRRIFIEPPFESRSYINMTISAMKMFGVEIIWDDEFTLFIKGGQKYHNRKLSVEGDYSGAAFLDAFNILGGNVNVCGLNNESFQGDMIYKKYFPLLENGFCELDVSDCPDLAPILMTVGALKHGVKLTGTKRLKIKESDRGVVMAQELAKFGVRTDVYDDYLVVHKCKLKTTTELLNGHNDHRVVMSLAVICSVFSGKIIGCESVSKSFPDFFDKFTALGGKVKLYDN